MQFWQARITMMRKVTPLPMPDDDERLQVSTAFGDSILVAEYIHRETETVTHAVFLGQFDQRPC